MPSLDNRDDDFVSNTLEVSPDSEPRSDPGDTPEFDASPEALDELEATEEAVEFAVESRSLPPVRWAADAEQPDYAHSLVADRAGLEIEKTFTFDLATFKLLARANHFKPAGYGDNVMFGLRGAVLTEGDDLADERAISLRDTRPDHDEFRCTIGIVNLASGRIDAFASSTVPNKKWMRNYYRKKHNIRPFGSTNCNILPTGCYIYRVAGHKSNKIRPAMRMCNPDNIAQDGACTVLRSYDDLTYSHDDYWHKTTPYDNIHCAYSYRSFSSAGCQTIKGPNGEGPWGRFQGIVERLGYGKRLDYMLLTGRDAAIAAAILASGRQDDAALVRVCLERLRVGSQGETVVAAQRKMGFRGSGYFGPTTKEALTGHEKGASLSADGIYSPDDDMRLGWNVFGEAAPSPAPGPTPTPTPTPVDDVTAAARPLTLLRDGEALAAGEELAVEGGVWSQSGDDGAVFKPSGDSAATAVTVSVGEGAAAVPVNLSLTVWGREGGGAPPIRIAITAEPGAAAPQPEPAPEPSPAAQVLIDDAQFRRFAPRALAKYREHIVAEGDAILARYGLNTARRLTHFLAQIGHETGGFTIERESLYYTTAKRLMQVWPRRFPTIASTRGYLRNEEALAMYVYGGRLGNNKPGDGYRYRGRGMIQLTGKAAYEEYGERLGIDLVAAPERAADADVAFLVACEYWANRKLRGERSMNELADDEKLGAITYRINGGYTNIADRRHTLDEAREIWPDDGPIGPRPRIVERGDQGDDVALLQRLLIARGVLSGSVDGKFGYNTLTGLRSFKDAAGLDRAGIADDATFAALQRRGAGVEMTESAAPRIGAEPEPARGGVGLAAPEPEPDATDTAA